MEYNCELIDRKTYLTMAIRTHSSLVNLSWDLGRCFDEVKAFMKEYGIEPVGSPYAAYYCLDFDNLDVEIGYPVEKQIEGKGNVKPASIPGGKMATTIHVGSYSDMEPAYQALSDWMKQQNLETSGVSYEIYKSDHTQMPSHDLQTRILFPVKD
ncbi:MAG: GyrI-like domain-containing protein [Bacteroidota bacterium]